MHLRRHRLTHRILVLLAAIWLSLALQPCAMAYAPTLPDSATQHSHCPQCPEYQAEAESDCTLSDWQLTKSASSSASSDYPPPALIHFILLQHALWQPLVSGISLPRPDPDLLYTDLPVFRQDILRL